jgi:cytochrome c oxidase subunit IV
MASIEEKIEKSEEVLESQGTHHVVPYKTHVIVLLTLVVLTGLSVAVTSIELGPLTVTVALLLASTKAVLVLLFFMHLRFDNILYTVFLVLTLFSIISIVIITFLDYLFR